MAVSRHDPLAPMDRRVLYYLTDLADDQDTRTITVYLREIGEFVGISKRRVQTCLKKLKRAEYITTQTTKEDHGGYGPLQITIMNPDRERHGKIKIAAEIAGIPLWRMVEHVHWLHFYRDKLKQKIYPTIGDITVYSHLPATEDAQAYVRGLVAAGILTKDREVNF